MTALMGLVAFAIVILAGVAVVVAALGAIVFIGYAVLAAPTTREESTDE